MTAIGSNVQNAAEGKPAGSEDDMTRETKIGLLVGLAFIIVIGILLSDHFTSSMNPPTDPRKIDPRTAIDTSIGDYTSRRTPGQGVTQVDPVRPRNQIPFPGNGNNNRGGSIRVEVDPGGNNPVPPRNGGNEQAGSNPGNPPGNGTGGNNPGNERPTPPTDPSRTNPRQVEHVAVQGDTLWSIARKYYGKSVSRADIERIVNANPSLKANRNKIVVDETYIIPPQTADTSTDSGTAADTSTRPPVRPHETGNEDHTDAPPVVENRTPANPPATTAEIVYTTKAGDSLWKIANEKCGAASKPVLDQIRQMNKDVLKNGDALHPNMKLKLPPKTVAAAN